MVGGILPEKMEGAVHSGEEPSEFMEKREDSAGTAALGIQECSKPYHVIHDSGIGMPFIKRVWIYKGKTGRIF